MSAATKIEWVRNPDGTPGATWSPVRGCTRVSAGCQGCYAERMAARNLPGMMPKGYSTAWGDRPYAENTPSGPRWSGRVELIESQLEIPLHWRNPRRIFVNSMSDTFHEALPDEAIDRIFAVMALCPQHTFMVLTKRAKRMREYWNNFRDRLDQIFRVSLGMGKLPGSLVYGSFGAEGPRPLPNVRLGVSVEDRSTKHRIDVLRETPAALKFLSFEPLLEDLGELDLRGIGWVIVGSESGPNARFCEESWVRSIKDQCIAAGIPLFYKQRIVNGKKISLPELDGKTWTQFPQITVRL